MANSRLMIRFKNLFSRPSKRATTASTAPAVPYGSSRASIRSTSPTAVGDNTNDVTSLLVASHLLQDEPVSTMRHHSGSMHSSSYSYDSGGGYSSCDSSSSSSDSNSSCD
jgi:hypothetical protein